MEDTNTTQDNGRELTFGEKAVGLTFNPAGNDDVAQLKRLCASFIDHCDKIRSNTTDAEVLRMLAIAMTEAQTAQMWAVKAVTWSN